MNLNISLEQELTIRLEMILVQYKLMSDASKTYNDKYYKHSQKLLQWANQIKARLVRLQREAA